MRRRDVRRRAPWVALGALLVVPLAALLVLAGRYPAPAVGVSTALYALGSVGFDAARFWRNLPP
jgi:hypothetical protein